LFIGGLQHPRFAAGCGAVSFLGRIVFATVYYTGAPDKRQQGFFGMFGLMGLLGSTLCFAAHQLKWSHPDWMKV